ncbi:MAG: ABC transporter ATP-binding protein [Candidatus Zixiibacteriota bacterium]
MNRENPNKPNQPIIHLKNVAFSYNGENVLENVNVEIFEKEFIWIVGPNGGGKTTLIKIILGLLRPQQGIATVYGEKPRKERHRIGYMTQETDLDLQYPVTVLDVALMGRIGNGGGGLFKRLTNHDKKIAESALSEVGLENLKDKPFSNLSGGQLRRLLIARALAVEPDILILDEPNANLDVDSEKELYNLLKKLNERLTIITVSHDSTFVSDFVKRVLCVNREVHEHPTSAVNGEFASHLFDGRRRIVQHNRDIGEDYLND